MKKIFAIAISLSIFGCSQNSTISIKSPDKNIQVQFGINESNAAYYSVSYQDSLLIAPSKMGFDFEGQPGIGKNVTILSSVKQEVNKLWQPVYGEKNEIQDHYNTVKIHLKDNTPPKHEFEITFRVYNEGVAFNYTFLKGEKDSVSILKELSEFKLQENYNCWASDRAQSEITKRKIGELENPVERPLLIKTENCFVALGEAKLIDFARMKLKTGNTENSLVADLHDKVNFETPYTTPWRTIMIGDSPGELLENNYLLLNLNDPCAIDDVSWIKPGKVIREVTLTTQGGMACVDFAAENGLQYVEFDAGWYGPEYDDSSDATTITVDPKRSPGPLDLHKVIEYAETRNVGIIVYVNRRALEKQIDEILPLYRSWGIKGVKYGFVQVGSQEWTSWLHEAVKKAADNKLMVDIHDEYRPTGFSRTYPNLMTQEGIRGDEESPSNEHTLTTLFTRMLAGAGDNTNCYYAPRVQEEMGGNVSQLAKAVMLYSPWQFLYWYDRPQGSPGKKGGAGSSEGYIQNHPELEFFKNLPTVWDDTKVLEGEIGKYATIARRKGNDWYLGSLTGEQKRTLNFQTGFLSPDSKYKATIYFYDPKSKSSTKVGIQTMNVDSNKLLSFNIKENSGLAIYFQKQ